jgi:four helix bundle protein
MSIKSYRDLKVWQKSMDLVVESYKAVNLLPRNEVYSLATQIQRAAVSIAANIEEGHGRQYLGDYLHHLSCANGSLMELETHFFIVNRLSYITEAQLQSLLDNAAELGRMLAGLIGKLKARRESPDT